MKFYLAMFANGTKKTVVNSAIYLHLYNYTRAHNKTFTNIFSMDLFALKICNKSDKKTKQFGI